MGRKARIIVGLLGVLVVLGVAGALFLRYQIHKSFPQVTGSRALQGLENPVAVRRDPFGVPHIAAANEHDLLFAAGFVHAQDRLWQMDVARRAGEGRLSEIFGGVTLEFDRMFRIVGIRRIAEELRDSMTQESLQRLQAYADGINAFIVSHKGRYPAEFDLLQYEPEPWTPLSSIIIGRMMSWELNMSWWTDLVYGAIAARAGMERTLEILPPSPAGVRPTVSADEWRRYADVGTGFLHTAQAYTSFFGSQGLLGGSNAWVVAPSKSASGKIVLANDTHLRLQCPSKWYEMYLASPGLTVGGMSIPGVPGIVAGNNAHIAWGVTNLMADDADFYIERIDSSDGSRYFYDGEWRPITVREEEITVKGDSAQTVAIRSTHHGPIVTDINTMLTRAQYPFVATMRWTGTEISDEIEAFYKINHAHNWHDFTAGVREFAGPGQNFVYGDAEGNIGYWCGVKLPIRSSRQSLLPLSGWERSSEWKGFVPFDRLPHLFNPPEGYIATANNKVVDDSYPYHISDLWEPPARIQRLRDRLGRPDLFGVDDFQRLQNDVHSEFAREVVAHLLVACESSMGNRVDAARTFEYFRNWNYEFSADDVATAIFQEFFVRLLRNTFEDEMGGDLFHDFVMLGNVPIRVTTKLLASDSSSWFDNVRTPELETRDDILRRSLGEALDSLRARFGNDMINWRWGKMHTVTFRHPFSLALPSPLDKIFTIGPFPAGGGATTLISGEYSFNEPFEVTVGASFRHIVDFAHPFETHVVLPPGQSGQVLHEHFDDQTQLWLHGGYRTVLWDSASVATTFTQGLILEPQK